MGWRVPGAAGRAEGGVLVSVGDDDEVFGVFFFNVYLFLRERERQSASREGAGREGDTESETGSRLRAGSSNPQTARS